jgi:hypothetical protein
MTIIQLNADNTVEQLLEIADELPDDKLDTLVSRLLMMNAERRQPHLNGVETRLFQIINRGLPKEVQQRYDELHEKRLNETISPSEYDVLLTLVEQIEQLQAERLSALIELAQLRGITVKALMHSLGIKSPSYA